MKKALPLILGVALAIILLAVGVPVVLKLVDQPTPKKAAQRFFKLLGTASVSTAYDMTSAGFRRKTSEEQLGAMSRELGLDEYASIAWLSEAEKNRKMRLEGTVTTNAGYTFPIRITMVQEAEEWKVSSFSKTQKEGEKAGGPEEKSEPASDNAKETAPK